MCEIDQPKSFYNDVLNAGKRFVKSRLFWPTSSLRVSSEGVRRPRSYDVDSVMTWARYVLRLGVSHAHRQYRAYEELCPKCFSFIPAKQLQLLKLNKRTVSIDQGDPFVRYIKFRFVKDYYENYISIKPKQTKKLLLTKWDRSCKKRECLVFWKYLFMSAILINWLRSY